MIPNFDGVQFARLAIRTFHKAYVKSHTKKRSEEEEDELQSPSEHLCLTVLAQGLLEASFRLSAPFSRSDFARAWD
jgi:hypothetical protein